MKVTFKEIIRNLIEKEVDSFIEKRGIDFVIQDIEIVSATKDFDYPSFKSTFKIDYQEYVLSGYISRYGYVTITSLFYEYDCYTSQENMNNNIITHKSFFIYGKELKEFKFN